MQQYYDVIVVGGGTAGAIAAIQAGRLGARTLLIEKNGMLGGTTTVAGVNFPGLFHAWGRQIVAGIGWDLVTRACELSGYELPDFSNYKRPHWLLQVRLNPAIYAALLDEAVLGAGVDLLLHTMVGEVQRSYVDALLPLGDLPADTPTEPQQEWRLTLCCKEGLRTVTTRVLLDCTGDANVVGMAGYGREMSSELQPGTIRILLGGYEYDALDMPRLEAAYQEAVAKGDLLAVDMGSRAHPLDHFLRNRGENAIHVTGIDGSTSAGKSHAEVKGRQALMRIYHFLRRLPGLEKVTIDACATETGIRETYTIVGKKKITHHDYTSGRLWEDAVCYSFYPIDIHRADGDGIDIRPLAEGAFPTIPRGAFLPRDSRNLMVAGRAVAGDKESNSAYRVQASCMGMGQAAGALAALAVLRNCDVEEVPLPRLYDVLAEYGAIVPGTIDQTHQIRNPSTP